MTWMARSTIGMAASASGKTCTDTLTVRLGSNSTGASSGAPRRVYGEQPAGRQPEARRRGANHVAHPPGRADRQGLVQQRVGQVVGGDAGCRAAQGDQAEGVARLAKQLTAGRPDDPGRLFRV